LTKVKFIYKQFRLWYNKIMIHSRYIADRVLTDLREKMVLVGGPRQVGKTTFARMVAAQHFPANDYLNWDYRPHRARIASMSFASEAKLLVFDEIHKYRQWKTCLKGLYDERRKDFSVLVTGSARLDVYRRGGDSLLGRYHYHRLHPFSVGELLGRSCRSAAGKELQFDAPGKAGREAVELLMRFGGFPEPLFKQSERAWRRWMNERVERLVREDIRDIEPIRDMGNVQMLADMLPGKVGSLFSLNAAREDLGVAHKTAAAWLDVLERFYYHYRVYPFTRTPLHSLRKAPKVYLWDWSEVQHSEAARFENLLASHLLKLAHWLHDSEGHDIQVYFWRDVQGRKVDFIVAAGKKPWFAVEVKAGDQEMSPHLHYLAARVPVPFMYQVLRQPGVDVKRGPVRIISADKFLAALP